MFDRVKADIQASKNKGKLVDIIEFALNPYYLGKRVQPDRFKNQATILKCFYNIPLDKKEKDWIDDLKRDSKTNWTTGQKYRTLVLEVGQRSGKSFDIGIILAYEIYQWLETPEPWKVIPKRNGAHVLAPGSPVECKLIATSRDNARDHVFHEAKAFIEHSPYFQGKFNLDKQSKKLEIDFPEYDLKVMAGSSTAKSIRGGTGLFAGLDEMDHMIGTSTAVGGEEIYRAIENTLASINGRLAIITSPRTVDDQGWQLFRRALSGETKGVLAFNLTTFEMDPTQSMEEDFYLRKRSSDPEGFERDFMAKPSAAVEPFIRVPEWLDKIFVFDPPGMIDPPGEMVTAIKEEKVYLEMLQYVLSSSYPVLRGCRYVLSCDPSETNDAFGVSLYHLSTDKQHIDMDLCIRFIPPAKYGTGGEIDASLVQPLVIALCRKFHPTYISDKFGWTELRQQVKRTGCKVKEINMDFGRAVDAKKALYESGMYPEGHELYDGQLVRAYMCPQLRKELLGMEIINGKRIEYPRKPGQCGHGDMAITTIHCVAELYDPRTMSKIKEFDAPWSAEKKKKPKSI